MNKGKLLLAAGLGICMLTGQGTGNGIAPMTVLEVKAAESVSVSQLNISAASDGICAGCTFSGYDSDSGYTMQLHLEQINGDGSSDVVTYLELAPTADGTGQVRTDAIEVESGSYRAVLVMNTTDDGGNAVVRFENSPLYDVIKNGNDYEVTQHPDGTLNQGSTKVSPHEAKDVEQESEEIGCTHQYEQKQTLWQEATAKEDAVMAISCSVCDAVISYQKVLNSAYLAFLEESTEAIREAEVNGQVIIKTDRWMSFDSEVIHALADRPDVSVRIEYRYQGEKYAVLIPSGTDVSSLPDENGFCGFRYLDKVFGKDIHQ